MQIFKFNLLNSILIILFLLIAVTENVSANTTFFDQEDEAFIMNNSASTSPTGEVIGETGSDNTGGSSSCLTNWSCSPWSSCVEGIQIRNCTKEKTYCYADLNIKPIENQSCSIKTENNTNSEKENSISQNFPTHFKNITVIVIGLVIIIGIAVFFAYKKYKKNKNYLYNSK
ncbi:MAG: hypothetical protein WC812_01130 [Candidatus Pacearchaeota archaeon]|jgi:hypothetical protein